MFKHCWVLNRGQQKRLVRGTDIQRIKIRKAVKFLFMTYAKSLLPVIYYIVQSDLFQTICLIAKIATRLNFRCEGITFIFRFWLFTLPSSIPFTIAFPIFVFHGYPVQLINIKCKHFFTSPRFFFDDTSTVDVFVHCTIHTSKYIWSLYIFYLHKFYLFTTMSNICSVFFVKYNMDEENLNSYVKVLKLLVHTKF